jgi:hypothetical protein
MAKIVWTKIGEASPDPKVAPTRSEGGPLQVRRVVISSDHVPPAHFDSR